MEYSLGVFIGYADSPFNIVWVILSIGLIHREYPLGVSIGQADKITDVPYRAQNGRSEWQCNTSKGCDFATLITHSDYHRII
jgi:hypothetical protein